MRPANERRLYNVTSSLISWAHSQNDPWSIYFCDQLQLFLQITSFHEWKCLSFNWISKTISLNGRRLVSQHILFQEMAWHRIGLFKLELGHYMFRFAIKPLPAMCGIIVACNRKNPYKIWIKIKQIIQENTFQNVVYNTVFSHHNDINISIIITVRLPFSTDTAHFSSRVIPKDARLC